MGRPPLTRDLGTYDFEIHAGAPCRGFGLIDTVEAGGLIETFTPPEPYASGVRAARDTTEKVYADLDGWLER